MLRLLLIVTATAALAPAAPVPKAPKPLYHPIRVGDTAVYAHNGTEEAVVVAKVERKGEGWLVTRETVEKDGTRRPRDKVHVSPTGLLVLAGLSDEFDTPLPVLKLPTGGAGWAARASSPNLLVPQDATYKAAKGGTVKVGAGAFETVRVDCEYTTARGKATATAYYAARVGLVKLEVDAGRHSDLTELKSFTPGKD